MRRALPARMHRDADDFSECLTDEPSPTDRLFTEREPSLGLLLGHALDDGIAVTSGRKISVEPPRD